jgi:hypothetical protein
MPSSVTNVVTEHCSALLLLMLFPRPRDIRRPAFPGYDFGRASFLRYEMKDVAILLA